MKNSIYKIISIIAALAFIGSVVYAETSGGLTVPQGGTGITTAFPGALLVGSSTLHLTSTTSPTVGYITATSTTASSTFSNGIILTGGCYVINGACLTPGGGSGTPGGANTQVQFNSAGAFGADSGFVYNGGKVGIGTTTPQSALTVLSNSDGAFISTLRLENNGNNAGSASGILFKAGGSTDGYKAGISFTKSSTGFGIGNLQFLQNSTAGNSDTTLSDVAMTITSAHNVGIGTTSPYNALSVYGTTTSSLFEATSTATSTFAGAIQADYFNGNSSTASSSLSNGISLRGGCYAIGKNCVGVIASGSNNSYPYYDASGLGLASSLDITRDSSGNIEVGGASAQLKAKLTINSNVSIGANYASIFTPPTSGLLVQGQSGFGSSTPGAFFAVNDTNDSNQVPIFIVASSSPAAATPATTTSIIVTSGGQIGLGTSTASTTSQVTIDGSLFITSSNGAMTVGLPYGNARGANSIDFQSSRNAAAQVASGGSAMAFGLFNTVSGFACTGVGSTNTCSGGSATALGNSNSASNNFAQSIGSFNVASAADAGAFGRSCTSNQANAMCFGWRNTTSAIGASTFGSNIQNSVASSTQIGPDNSSKLTITWGGNTGLGTTTPQSQFTVASTTSATTTVEFGDRYSTNSKACFNTKNNTGANTSFYFVGTALVVEAGLCK